MNNKHSNVDQSSNLENPFSFSLCYQTFFEVFYQLSFTHSKNLTQIKINQYLYIHFLV